MSEETDFDGRRVKISQNTDKKRSFIGIKRLVKGGEQWETNHNNIKVKYKINGNVIRAAI